MENDIEYTIEEVYDILESIVSIVEPGLFNKLNGGIILLEDTKYHEKANKKDLLVLGEYARFGTRRQINIYYGSIRLSYAHLKRFELRNKLEELIYHELRHHTESLAGINDLELEDEAFLENYKGRNC